MARAALLVLARAAAAPQTPRTLLLSAALVPTASAGLFTAYHVNVVNRTHAYINTTHKRTLVAATKRSSKTPKTTTVVAP